jgi:glycosyltransferase involved in cell wall biosynthesis
MSTTRPTTDSRRRLLFATDVVLLPPDQGMRVRVMNLLQGCARDHAVTLIAPPPAAAADRVRIEALCAKVEWLDEPAERVGLWSAAGRRAWRVAPGLRRPANVRRFLPFLAALDRTDPGSFDVIWAERPHVARLFHPWRGRTVIDLDDIEHRRQERARAFRRPAGLLANLEYHYRYRLYRQLELEWAREFLATVVCSDPDRDYLRSQGVRNAAVVPNAINEAALGSAGATRRPPGQRPLRLAFLGNVGHPPNLDAIEYLGSDLLPLLRGRAPGVVVDVLGPCAHPELEARFAGQINFLGYVPDLAKALGDYDLLVAPIRFGSGTRVKLLDAMACRIPVVSSTAGAEGLPVVDGVHLLLADTPTHFVEQVLRVIDDPALATRLASEGAALVDSRFRGEAIQADMANWLRGLTPRL